MLISTLTPFALICVYIAFSVAMVRFFLSLYTDRHKTGEARYATLIATAPGATLLASSLAHIIGTSIADAGALGISIMSILLIGFAYTYMVLAIVLQFLAVVAASVFLNMATLPRTALYTFASYIALTLLLVHTFFWVLAAVPY